MSKAINNLIDRAAKIVNGYCIITLCKLLRQLVSIGA